MQQTEQQFLNELEKKLWTSANKLLPSLDASQYKHVVLGLVFLKYVSDSFDIRRKQLTEQFTNRFPRWSVETIHVPVFCGRALTRRG